MAKVTYAGDQGSLVHKGSGAPILFLTGVPEKVTREQAEFYALEAQRGGPWVVELDPVEKVLGAVEAVPEAITGAVKKRRSK